jgi:hypothetical protein
VAVCHGNKRDILPVVGQQDQSVSIILADRGSMLVVKPRAVPSIDQTILPEITSLDCAIMPDCGVGAEHLRTNSYTNPIALRLPMFKTWLPSMEDESRSPRLNLNRHKPRTFILLPEHLAIRWPFYESTYSSILLGARGHNPLPAVAEPFDLSHVKALQNSPVTAFAVAMVGMT